MSLLAEEGWEGFLKEEGGKVSPAGYCEMQRLPTLQIQDGPREPEAGDPLPSSPSAKKFEAVGANLAEITSVWG